MHISAVIPTYNRADLVGRVIQSALDQTLPPVEIIVVDDGSTDHTRSVVESFGSPVRWLYKENAGVAAARNTGVDVMSSDWVAFLDSDDLWAPDHLQRIAAAITATDGRALIYFDDLQEDGVEASWWERSGFDVAWPFEIRDDPADWFMRRLQPMTTQATVVRKDAYLRVGGQSLLTCREDTHFFFSLGFTGPACAVTGVGAMMTADADSRLTSPGSASLTYCLGTIALYGDILRRYPSIRREHKAELRRRLGHAYCYRARSSAADRAFGKCAGFLARCLFTSPSTLVEKARAAVGHL